jgi:hypothetical protein
MILTDMSARKIKISNAGNASSDLRTKLKKPQMVKAVITAR